MKKQNLIIIGIFIVLVFGFYLISCNHNEEIIDDIVITESEYVTIKISGEVYREGEYKVPGFWTLKNLLDYVGVKNTAELNSLNLSEIVEDGKNYIINSKPKKTEENNKININTASKEELMTLSGIGESIANKIISYRKNTPFRIISDIKNVSGVGDSLYEKIKDLITV